MESVNGSERWNFNVMLSRGTTEKVAYQLAGPTLVLPFLYLALGAPVMFAGLLLPVVQISKLVSQLVCVPLVSTARVRKWYLMLGVITVAAALAVIGIAATRASATWLAIVFLLCALAIGIGQGLGKIAYQDLLGRVVPSHRRDTLVYTAITLAGVLAVVIAWGHGFVLHRGNALASHLVLVWIGIGIFVLTAIFNGLIRESRALPRRPEAADATEPTESKKGFFAELVEGARKTRQVRWFRHFTVTRALATSVTFALPFYAIHASSLHAQKVGSLAIFVIAAAVGLVVAGPVWRLVGRTSIRAVLIAAPLTAAAAGTLAIAVHQVPALQTIIFHAPVFFLASAAAQGMYGAAQIYLVGLAPEADRPLYVALSSTIAGAVGVVASFGLGVLAHINDASWPVMVLVVLNLATFLYSYLFLSSTGMFASAEQIHSMEH